MPCSAAFGADRTAIGRIRAFIYCAKVIRTRWAETGTFVESHDSIARDSSREPDRENQRHCGLRNCYERHGPPRPFQFGRHHDGYQCRSDDDRAHEQNQTDALEQLSFRDVAFHRILREDEAITTFGVLIARQTRNEKLSLRERKDLAAIVFDGGSQHKTFSV